MLYILKFIIDSFLIFLFTMLAVSNHSPIEIVLLTSILAGGAITFINHVVDTIVGA